jgi:hypothetical protein
MNKKELIDLADKIKKFDNIIWPFGKITSVFGKNDEISKYSRSIIVAFLTLFMTPVSIKHFCDAGCREMEIAIGIPLVIFAYLYVFYGVMPKKRWKYILCIFIWLIGVFQITMLYHKWIHGPNSPWPSSMNPVTENIEPSASGNGEPAVPEP